MNPPKVYLFDLKEHELPILYFQDGKVTGLYCSVCKKQHSHALMAPNQPVSSVAPIGHPCPKGWDYGIVRKEFQEVANVARGEWLEECTKQVENIVNILRQSDLGDYNIFMFRKFLPDGTCDIGSFGRKGTAKRKTHRKLQAVADDFIHRMNNLKAFW